MPEITTTDIIKWIDDVIGQIDWQNKNEVWFNPETLKATQFDRAVLVEIKRRMR